MRIHVCVSLPHQESGAWKIWGCRRLGLQLGLRRVGEKLWSEMKTVVVKIGLELGDWSLG